MFEWSNYLALARDLAQDPREQHGRAAISRAYYAAFNHVRKHIERAGNATVSTDGRAHDEVHDELKRMNLMLATKLRELKQLRIWADYRGNTKEKLEEDVKKALSHATMIIEKIK